ncbi:hypothetical protein HEK616_43280 [Streptomyces nigrescens]|uniref:Uncharacterized protein n=1 Tax=Streptomyces nigrescens TaxID=1920 RepID=A0ABN6R1M9_STRNI|nr:hypothetical protein HEK616_43280 [Streptomyces nigrescens]
MRAAVVGVGEIGVHDAVLRGNVQGRTVHGGHVRTFHRVTRSYNVGQPLIHSAAQRAELRRNTVPGHRSVS